MRKVFEDEFMELQSGLISLCMEVVDGKVDKIFAYGSKEKKTIMFNAFFEVGGEIKTLNQLGVSRELAFEFLGLGIEDLEKMGEIGAKYNRPVPTELKLYYDVRTGQFRSEYKYHEVCSADTGISSEEVFNEWLAEMRGQQ